MWEIFLNELIKNRIIFKIKLFSIILRCEEICCRSRALNLTEVCCEKSIGYKDYMQAKIFINIKIANSLDCQTFLLSNLSIIRKVW